MLRLLCHLDFKNPPFLRFGFNPIAEEEIPEKKLASFEGVGRYICTFGILQQKNQSITKSTTQYTNKSTTHPGTSGRAMDLEKGISLSFSASMCPSA